MFYLEFIGRRKVKTMNLYKKSPYYWMIMGPQGLPWWLSGKESACQCKRDRFNLGVGTIPWRRKWQPIPIFLPGKSHGWRNLAGYSPWNTPGYLLQWNV